MTIADIQRALLARGHDVGPADGVWGRRSIAGLKAFQADAGIAVDGVIGPESVAALNLNPPKGSAGRTPIVAAPKDPVWLAEARRKMGLHEARDRSVLMAWLRSDGRTLGDPAKLPWCGDFVETCIALTLPAEPMVVNPYYALNWLKFGLEIGEASPGAILVFFRDGGGHVGFAIGERADAYRVLGGNQSNAVTEAWIAKSRLKGIRWPRTAPLPGSGKVLVSAGGALSRNEA